MRMSWRFSAMMLLASVWPQLGCLNLPSVGSSPPTKPLEQHIVAKPAKQEPSPAEVGQSWKAQAEALENAGRNPEAIAMYEKLRQTGGENAWYATSRLALLHDRNNDLDQAEQEYRQLLSKNPIDGETLSRLGSINFRRGHWGTAYKLLSDAESYQPTNPHTLHTLGLTLARLELYDDSLEKLSKVLPKADAYCQVAFILNLQGKRDHAARAYQEALNLQPNMALAQAALKQMELAGPIAPTALAKNALPSKAENRGNVELEESATKVAQVSDEGMSRLMSLRPTLPPLPEVDLTSGTSREGEVSVPRTLLKSTAPRSPN